ncbi:FecR domain-containing protein [Planctomycetales bacterium ZRK34]|nr:FecR domain-containing protein [Planctomycetales bacterium ZRK34]
MSPDSTTPLAEWITAQREDALSHEDHAALDALLRDDAEARRQYILLAMIDTSCQMRFASDVDLDVATAHDYSAGNIINRRDERFWNAPALKTIAALAAAVLIIATVGFVVLSKSPPTPGTVDPLPMVATIVRCEGARWSSTPLHEGQDLRPGYIAIDAGEVEVLFADGSMVTLSGRSELELTSTNTGYLSLGTLTATSLPGFTITAPHGVRVVDLGTRFSVQVGATGEATVGVWDGSVRVYRDATDSGVVLTTGDMARLYGGRAELSRADRSTPAAYASVIEGFDYRLDTTLSGQGFLGNGFTGPWRGPTAFSVTAEGQHNMVGEVHGAAGNVYIDRTLVSPIDFDHDGVYYMSFVIRDEDVDARDEYFWVGLQSSGDADPTWGIKAAFGLSSNEHAMLAINSTLNGYIVGPAIATDRWQRYLCRVQTRAEGADEISLLILDAEETTPRDEPLEWTMTLSRPITGIADELHIQAGPKTRTRFDDIRIGATLDSALPSHRSESPRSESDNHPPSQKEISE